MKIDLKGITNKKEGEVFSVFRTPSPLEFNNSPSFTNVVGFILNSTTEKEFFYFYGVGLKYNYYYLVRDSLSNVLKKGPRRLESKKESNKRPHSKNNKYFV